MVILPLQLTPDVLKFGAPQSTRTLHFVYSRV